MPRYSMLVILVTLTAACTTSQPAPKLVTKKVDPSKQRAVPPPDEEFIAPLGATKPLSKCGTERWAVKTLSDKKA